MGGLWSINKINRWIEIHSFILFSHVDEFSYGWVWINELFCHPYLEVSLGGNPMRKEYWRVVVKKFNSKLSKWKSNFISLSGRSMLAQAVAIPLYQMTLLNKPIELWWRWKWIWDISCGLVIRRNWLNHLEGCWLGWNSSEEGRQDYDIYDASLSIEPGKVPGGILRHSS